MCDHRPAVEETITCIDCGGPARLLSLLDPDDPPQPGDVVAYRCVDCLDRWDVVVPGDDGSPDPTDRI